MANFNCSVVKSVEGSLSVGRAAGGNTERGGKRYKSALSSLLHPPPPLSICLDWTQCEEQKGGFSLSLFLSTANFLAGGGGGEEIGKR